MKINKYILERNSENYIIGFHTVISGDFDYEGQMANYPEACEGWYKFENNEFIVDEVKKAEILEKREEEAKEAEREAERPLAQIEYTAMMTGTLLEG